MPKFVTTQVCLGDSPDFHNFSQKLKDTVPEVKQATPPEERHSGGPRGGPSGRGRGGRGGFAARGFAAAGLTKGASKGNGESSSTTPAPSGDN
jgi:hypothetical protein